MKTPNAVEYVGATTHEKFNKGVESLSIYALKLGKIKVHRFQS